MSLLFKIMSLFVDSKDFVECFFFLSSAMVLPAIEVFDFTDYLFIGLKLVFLPLTFFSPKSISKILNKKYSLVYQFTIVFSSVPHAHTVKRTIRF